LTYKFFDEKRCDDICCATGVEEEIFHFVCFSVGYTCSASDFIRALSYWMEQIHCIIPMANHQSKRNLTN
jgi:hypothetical protein